MQRIGKTALAAFAALILAPALAIADTPQTGTPQTEQKKSAFDKAYDPAQATTIMGTVQNVATIRPMEGMDESVVLTVRTATGQTVPVHVGPAWFINRQADMLQQGDTIEVRGSRARVAGQSVIIASELQKGDMVLKLRNELGMPVWNAWRSQSEVLQEQQEEMRRRMEEMHKLMQQQEMERQQQLERLRQEEMQRQQQLEPPPY